MKGATRIVRRTQKQEEKEKPLIVSRRTNFDSTSQYNPSTQKNTATTNNQKDSPYKITIKTIYEKGRTNENPKEKPQSQNKSHFNETDYSKNQNIKLKPNKKVLINRKKEIKENKDNNEHVVDRQKFSRGLRPKEAEKEREELAKKENQYGRRNVNIITKEANKGEKPNIIITGSSQSNATQIVNINPVNNRRNNNPQNKDVQLLPNKKTVIKKSKKPIPNPSSKNTKFQKLFKTCRK